MQSGKHGRSVISNMTGNTVLMAENRQLKTELASVKNELMQLACEKDEARQLYSRSNLQCIGLVEQVRRLNDILLNVEGLNACMGRLLNREIIRREPVEGMTFTNREQQNWMKQSPSDVADSTWKHLRGSGDLGDGGSAQKNTDIHMNDWRAQTNSSILREITASRGILVTGNTEPTIEEEELSFLKNKKEWLLQQSSDIEIDSHGEDDWIYETLDDTAPEEQLMEEALKMDVLAEVIPSVLDGVQIRSQDAAYSSMKKKYKSESANDSVTLAPEKTFECYICNKMFTLKQNLSSHFRCHTGVGLFHCDYQSCGKSFTRQDYLTKHTRIHTGQKPFQCDFPECEKRFSENPNLSRHRRLHTGEKPYVCEWAGCTAHFRWKTQLNAHIRKGHPI